MDFMRSSLDGLNQSTMKSAVDYYASLSELASRLVLSPYDFEVDQSYSLQAPGGSHGGVLDHQRPVPRLSHDAVLHYHRAAKAPA